MYQMLTASKNSGLMVGAAFILTTVAGITSLPFWAMPTIGFAATVMPFVSKNTINNLLDRKYQVDKYYEESTAICKSVTTCVDTIKCNDLKQNLDQIDSILNDIAHLQINHYNNIQFNAIFCFTII